MTSLLIGAFRLGGVRRFARTFGAIVVAFLCCAGCDSLDKQAKNCPLFSNCPLFKEGKSESCLFKSNNESGSCLFSDKSKTRLTSQDEKEALARAADSGDDGSKAWDPTDEELAAAGTGETVKQTVDMTGYVWNEQRPNGGVLFPKTWQGNGSIVLLEPRSTVATLGSDVALVASYVGEDGEYMRVGEELDWNLSGVGSFGEASAPSPLFPNGNSKNSSCLFKTVSAKSNDSLERSLSTTTVGSLWRLNRGTSSKLDDVTILRGQAWSFVSSDKEGATSVVVSSDSASDPNGRQAYATIHWVDAAYLFPKSGVSATGQETTLTTCVRRRSDGSARQGWGVQYEILAGEGGLGADQARSALATVDADGNASVALKPRSAAPGSCKIAVSIIKPKSSNDEQFVVDSRTIFHTWTTVAPLTLRVQAPDAASVGDDMPYQIVVSNLSDFTQIADVEVTIPEGTEMTSAEQQPTQVSSDKSRVVWTVSNLPEHSSYRLNFTLRKNVEGPVNLRVRFVKTSPTEPGLSNSAPPQGTIAQPPTVSPTAPTTDSSAPSANSSLGTTPPTLSPSTGAIDQADVRPSL